jgi:hypothetical protein
MHPTRKSQHTRGVELGGWRDSQGGGSEGLIGGWGEMLGKCRRIVVGGTFPGGVSRPTGGGKGVRRVSGGWPPQGGPNIPSLSSGGPVTKQAIPTLFMLIFVRTPVSPAVAKPFRDVSLCLFEGKSHISWGSGKSGRV